MNDNTDAASQLSKDKDWDSTSTVRSRANTYQCRNLQECELTNKDWFFRAALPHLHHPELQALPPEAINELLARHLVHFLEYTTLLEHRVVNRAVECIAHGELSDALPREQRFQALQLYADEGYHAVMSEMVANDAVNRFDISVSTPREFSRITALEKTAESSSPRDRALTWFLIGLVSETAITQEFLRLTRPTLVPPVYRMFRDHLQDEWRHSQYFSKLVRRIWPQLTDGEKTRCVDILPNVILECFTLDDEWFSRTMKIYGISGGAISQMCEARSSQKALQARARDGAKSTLSALKLSGMFDAAAHRESFLAAGLIVRDAS